MQETPQGRPWPRGSLCQNRPQHGCVPWVERRVGEKIKLPPPRELCTEHEQLLHLSPDEERGQSMDGRIVMNGVRGVGMSASNTFRQFGPVLLG